MRARAQDLQKSIDEVIYGLRFNAGMLKWDDIIRKYSVINTQVRPPWPGLPPTPPHLDARAHCIPFLISITVCRILDFLCTTSFILNIFSQLAGLREALRPGTLDGFALLPRLVPDPGFAEAVTVQLASALTPEGEAAEAEAAAAVDAALGLGPDMQSMQRFDVRLQELEGLGSGLEKEET